VQKVLALWQERDNSSDMGKQGRWLLLCCAFGVCCGLAWSLFVSAPGEPAYAGRTLSTWLVDYPTVPVSPTNTASRLQSFDDIREIEVAVRQIGTNALPTLLNWLRADDTPITDNFARLAARHSWVPFHPFSSRDKNLMAFGGFRILGRVAIPAMPALRAMLHDQDFGVRLRAAIVLREIQLDPTSIYTAENRGEGIAWERAGLTLSQ
jgi:hypothetical protein